MVSALLKATFLGARGLMKTKLYFYNDDVTLLNSPFSSFVFQKIGFVSCNITSVSGETITVGLSYYQVDIPGTRASPIHLP